MRPSPPPPRGGGTFISSSEEAQRNGGNNAVTALSEVAAGRQKEEEEMPPLDLGSDAVPRVRAKACSADEEADRRRKDGGAGGRKLSSGPRHRGKATLFCTDLSDLRGCRTVRRGHAWYSARVTATMTHWYLLMTGWSEQFLDVQL